MHHVIRSYDRVPQEVVDAYAELEVATVHEAQEKRGAMRAAIAALTPGVRVCGTALTVKAQAGDNLMIHKALDIVAPGEVLVVDVEGWEGGPWGELMTVMAQARGCSGLVIDGYVRDSTAIRAAGFPVFARGTSIKGTFKQALGWVNHPISCGGVTVWPGDLLVGDDDGVCVVARGDAESVLEAARKREREENALRPRFAAGETLWTVADLTAAANTAGLREEPVAEVRR